MSGLGDTILVETARLKIFALVLEHGRPSLLSTSFALVKTVETAPPLTCCSLPYVFVFAL